MNNTDRVIAAIRDQTEGQAPHLVYVIEIVGVKFDNFTPELTAELERYQYLQMLTLNDCGIKSLAGFPTLNGLIRLDLVFNQIPGEDLVHLARSRHLQTIMLGANKIQKVDDLKALQGMKKLFQLDLLNNPIQYEPGYRVIPFEMFPSLMVLDTLDKSGKDAFNATSMVQTASRVPENLFDKSPIVPVVRPAIVIPPAVSHPRTVILPRKSAVVNTSVGKVTSKRMSAPVISGVKSHSRATRAGLVFPVSRIKRHLHQKMIGDRVSVTSSIYMAAVLEYVTAELLQVAGNVAKQEKKVRITPRMIRQAVENDQQLNKLMIDVTIPLQE